MNFYLQDDSQEVCNYLTILYEEMRIIIKDKLVSFVGETQGTVQNVNA